MLANSIKKRDILVVLYLLLNQVFKIKIFQALKKIHTKKIDEDRNIFILLLSDSE